MTSTPGLLARNQKLSANFTGGDLPIVPKLRTVIITCGDARVDPAHIFGLTPGESVVIRNNGGRVTEAVLEELATMALLVAKMDGGTPGPFEVVLMQHTQCGAERFANPEFQQMMLDKLGIDVSSTAISNHEQSVKTDIEKLRNYSALPDYVVASGFIYDVGTGSLTEVVRPEALRAQT